MLAKDYTIFAVTDGVVVFEPLPGDRKRISVQPVAAAPAEGQA
jgi:ribosomal protein L27